jgi:hypothetical protein
MDLAGVTSGPGHSADRPAGLLLVLARRARACARESRHGPVGLVQDIAGTGRLTEGATMNDFMDRAKDFADQHDKQVDKGIDRAGDEVDERTGGKYQHQVDKGVDMAQERTGQGDTSS